MAALFNCFENGLLEGFLTRGIVENGEKVV
jgi:hypothetical protein